MIGQRDPEFVPACRNKLLPAREGLRTEIPQRWQLCSARLLIFLSLLLLCLFFSSYTIFRFAESAPSFS